MSKKVILFSVIIVALLSVYFIGDIGGMGKYLGSSTLSSTCDNDFLREEKENYQKALADMKSIMDFARKNECEKISANTPQGKTCGFILSRGKDEQQKILDPYEKCRKKLFDEKTLDENNKSSTVLSTEGIKPGTREFVDPIYTCRSTSFYDYYDRNRGSSQSMPYGPILGTSFDGGFYNIANFGSTGSPVTLVKTKLSNVSKEQIWDLSFSFLGGDYQDVKKIVNIQEYADSTLYVLYQSFDEKFKLMKLYTNGFQDQSVPIVVIKLEGSSIQKIEKSLFLQDKRILIAASGTGDAFGGFSYTSFVMRLDGNEKNVWKNFPYGNTVIGQQSDGGIIYMQNTYSLGRVNLEGIIDTKFITPLFKSDKNMSCKPKNDILKVLPDDTIIMAGNFYEVNGISRNCIVRLDKDGKIDNGFDPGTSFKFSESPWGGEISLNYDGQKKLIATGGFTEYNGFTQAGLIRINLDGSPDKTLTWNENGRSYAMSYIGSPNTYPIFIGRNGDLIMTYGGLMSRSLQENKECFAGVENKNEASTFVKNICHADDFQRGIFKVKDKIYVPSGNTINVYSVTGEKLIKQIKRNPTLIGKFGLDYSSMYRRAGVILGKYAYVGSQYGVDILDTEKDEIVKTLGFRQKPDALPDATISKPGDVILQDKTLYRMLDMSNGLKDKYISGDSTTQYVMKTVSHESQMVADGKTVYSTPGSNGALNVKSFRVVGKYLYAVAEDRLVIIDTDTQTITHELQYAPGINAGQSGMYGDASFDPKQGIVLGGFEPISTNKKLYLFTGRRVSMSAYGQEREVKWFVFDTEKRELLKILENTVDHATGTCSQYPYWPISWVSQEDSIYMRFGETWYSTACGTMMLDTKTDTFSTVTNVPKVIETKLDLYGNTITFMASPIFQYAEHIIKWNGKNSNYDIVRMSDNKKIDSMSNKIKPEFVNMTMQYGDTLYVGTPATGDPDTVSLQKSDISNGLLSCEDK